MAALGGLLLLAAALRIVGASYGLPYPLLNPDEESIVPRAWSIAHGGGLDPGWFDYPSLLLYLLAPGQALTDMPSYGSARTVAILAGVGGVAAAWWLGRRAYGPAAGAVGAAGVAVAATHVAYSRMAVTDVLLTLLVTVALALAVTGRLGWAGMAVGLAASAKYPGAIAFVAVLAAGWGQWRRLAAAAGLALGAFALTSPFVVLRIGAAWDDVARVRGLAEAGWLGLEDDPIAPLAYLDRLWGALGPVLAVSALGLVIAIRRRARADVVLLTFAGAYALTLLTVDAHFDRYVLPLVPVLAVLAGRAPALAVAAALLLVVPLVWSARDARELTRTDTRELAAAWLETHAAPGTRVALDPSTVPGPPASLRLELPGPGRPADPRRDLERLRALGVEYLVVSGAVTDRVLAAREDYPRAAAFYDRVQRDADIVFAADPGEDGLRGPWVRIVRL